MRFFKDFSRESHHNCSVTLQSLRDCLVTTTTTKGVETFTVFETEETQVVHTLWNKSRTVFHILQNLTTRNPNQIFPRGGGGEVPMFSLGFVQKQKHPKNKPYFEGTSRIPKLSERGALQFVCLALFGRKVWAGSQAKRCSQAYPCFLKTNQWFVSPPTATNTTSIHPRCLTTVWCSFHNSLTHGF